MVLCIFMLQHEVMAVDEWHNDGPQDLIIVSSLCLPIPKPYHHHGALIHNVDISKRLSYNTIHSLRPARCSEIWDSSVKTTLLQSARCHQRDHMPTQVDYNNKLQSGQTLGEDDEHTDKFP